MILKKDVTPTVKRAIDDLNLGGVVYGELSTSASTPTAPSSARARRVDDSARQCRSGKHGELRADRHGRFVIYQQGNGGEEIPGTLTGSQEAVNGSDVR